MGVVPRRGGVLRLALAGVGTLDPAQAVSTDQRLLAGVLFTPLTRYDRVTLAPIPGLAESWEPTADLRRWDFTLRPGATFSDGRAVTGPDVVFTLDRIARKGSGSAVADLLGPVKGYAAVASGAASTLAGVTVPQPGVVRISLDRPLADLPSLLANPGFGVVPRGMGPSPSRTDPTVTSGPFTLAARSRSMLTLRPLSGGRALVGGITVLTSADQAASYDAFVRGSVDWALVPPASVDDAARRFGRAGYTPLAAELFYGFNLRVPAFADHRFRQALLEAIDRGAVATTAYHGAVLPSVGLIVAGIPGHQDNPCGAPCTYNPSGARTLLAQAFPAGSPPAIDIDFDQDPTQLQVARSIQADLAAVGVTATLRPHSLAEYQTFVLGGKAQLFRLGWVASYPAADAVLTPLFSSGVTTNLTGLSVPAVDQALTAARAEPDLARRIVDYQQAERLILDELPVIPIAQFETHAVISPLVRGLAMTSLGAFDPTTVWLDRP